MIPRQLMDDLGALRLDDVLDYVAGASRQNSFGGTWDNVSLRGFAGHEDTGMSLPKITAVAGVSAQGKPVPVALEPEGHLAFVNVDHKPAIVTAT